MLKKENIVKQVLLKLSKKDFNSDQLAKGKEIEQEHKKTIETIIDDAGNNKLKDISKYIELIVVDHLNETPNYYISDSGEDRLKQLEDTAKKELS